MRRYLCLYFPNWPIQWLAQVQPATLHRPAALFERLAHGQTVWRCSHEAHALGVRPGMSVADARVLAPDLILHPADPNAVRAALEDVCLWTERFSPLSGIEPVGRVCNPPAGCKPALLSPHFPESLWLDITGCEQVFRGEKNLLAQALSGLRRKGLESRGAIAPSFGAAWALAHCGSERAHILSGDPGELRSALEPLPVPALRPEPEALALLHSLGIECIGDLLKQPRATLPARFGAALVERIDQAFGDAPEILTPLRPPPEFHAARAFEYPLRSSELLFKIVEQLTAQLSRELQAAERGAREIECWLYHELAQPACVEARLFKGSASGKHLWKLIHMKLEDAFRKPHAVLLGEQRAHSKYGPNIVISAEEGICAVALQVRSSEKMGNGQLPLFEREADAAHDVSESLASLLDRLASRLGADAVLRVSPVEDPIPERAYKGAPFQNSARSKDKSLNASAALERPLRLLPEPAPLSVEWPARISLRGKHIALSHVSGAERIASGWWSERSAQRDYYIAEAESGARYWIFQRLDDARWFLHGTFE